jgi:hypothetical protein
MTFEIEMLHPYLFNKGFPEGKDENMRYMRYIDRITNKKRGSTK